MRTIPYLLAFAAAGLSIAGGGQAQAAVNDDARCLLTMVAISHDPKYTAFTQAAVPFFAGRIRAQDPNYNFELLKQVAKTYKAQDLQAEAKRCGPMAQEALSNLGHALAPPKSAAAHGAAAPAAKPAPPKP